MSVSLEVSLPRVHCLTAHRKRVRRATGRERLVQHRKWGGETPARQSEGVEAGLHRRVTRSRKLTDDQEEDGELPSRHSARSDKGHCVT